MGHTFNLFSLNVRMSVFCAAAEVRGVRRYVLYGHVLAGGQSLAAVERGRNEKRWRRSIFTEHITSVGRDIPMDLDLEVVSDQVGTAVIDSSTGEIRRVRKEVKPIDLSFLFVSPSSPSSLRFYFPFNHVRCTYNRLQGILQMRTDLWLSAT